MKCFAGCEWAEIVAALGLSTGDLFEKPASSGHKANGHPRRIVAVYDYTNQDGKLLFQSIRYAPKGFSQRKPDGEGGWLYKDVFKNGTRPVLYRLPEVLKAVREGRPIWAVEGEEDVHRLEQEGLTATTNPMGALKFRDHFSESLIDADVRIITDNDDPGRAHARDVAQKVQGKAASVKIVELPGLPEGGDVSDWFAAGGTTEELEELASSPSSPLGPNDDDDGSAGPPTALQLTSFASVERPSDERPVVVEGIIPQRFPSIIYGDGGTAKSLLSASLLLESRRGAEKWMGHRIKKHGPAIYLDFELDLEEQTRRVYQLAEGAGLNKPPEGFYYLSGADYPAGAVLTRTLQLAKEVGAAIVLLDSLGFALEGDAEASRDVLRFVREHIKPFESAGITLLIVDHQSKLIGGESYHQKSPFGSVYKSNACRSVIQVGVEDQQEGELIVRFRHAKANFGSKFDPFDVQVKFQKTKVEMFHRSLGSKELATEGSLNTTQKIRRLLKNGPMFPGEMTEEIGCTEGSVKNCLTSLRKSGEVEDTGVTSETGARQVRLINPPSSSSLRPRGDDDDDGSHTDDLAEDYDAMVADRMAGLEAELNGSGKVRL